MRKILTILALWLCVLGPMATGAWSQAVILDDTFARGTTTTVGSGANSTTGVPAGAGMTYASPSTGAAWIDVPGNLWDINPSGTLVGVNNSGPSYGDDLIRPSAENTLNAKMTAVITPNSGAYHFVKVRLSANRGAFYFAKYSLNSNSLQIGSASGITETVLASQAYTGTAGTSYVLAVSAQSTDGTHTNLTGTLSTTSGTVLATATVTGDTGGPQAAGGWALSTGNAASTQSNKFGETVLINLSGTPPPSFAAGPVSVVASSAGNVITLSGTNTAWTSGTTFSVSGATKTAQSWTDATHAAVTLTAGATVASNNITISDSTDSATATLSTVAAPVAATGYSLGLSSSSGSTGVPVTLTYTLTPSGGTSGGIAITPAQSGVSGSFSAGTVSLSTGTPSASVTFTPTTSGTAAFTATNTTDGASLTSTAAQSPASQTYTVNVAPLVVGSLTATATSSAITLTDTASGGTGPYTHRLFRGTTFAFTPTGATAGSGNCIAVQTGAGLSYADTPPAASTVYYYIDQVTDSQGTPVTVGTSAVQSVLPLAALNFGWIGDSISHQTAGNSYSASLNQAPQWAAQILQHEMGGVKTVTVNNQAISGTATNDWQPGGTDYNAAVASFVNPSVTPYVNIMLGANEAGSSASTYQTGLNNIVSALVTAGYKVILHAPIFSTPAGTGNDNKAAFGSVSIANIVTSYASSNPGKVYQGDTLAFAWFAANPSELADGTHPSQLGYQHLGTFWANSIRKIISPDVGGATTTGTKRRLQ